jgi:integrase
MFTGCMRTTGLHRGRSPFCMLWALRLPARWALQLDPLRTSKWARSLDTTLHEGAKLQLIPSLQIRSQASVARLLWAVLALLPHEAVVVVLGAAAGSRPRRRLHFPPFLRVRDVARFRTSPSPPIPPRLALEHFLNCYLLQRPTRNRCWSSCSGK